jgi:phage-related minor tail protein
MPDTLATSAVPSTPTTFSTTNIDMLRSDMADLTRVSRQFSASLATAFDSLVIKGRSLTDVVRTLGQSLSQIAMKAAFKPLEDAIGSGMSGLLSGGMSGGFGAGFGGLNFGFAHGGVFQGGVPVPFARGGVIASPITFPLGGGQHGIAGERGAEAIMPLARGPDGRLGVVSAGGRGVSVHVNITTSDIDSFQRAESQISALFARAVSRGHRNL